MMLLVMVLVSDGTSLIKEIACGQCHVCVRFDSGSLKCLGSSESGQAGVGFLVSTIGEEKGYTNDDVPAALLGTGINALGMALTSYYTCAKVTGNQVKCFGWNRDGNFGYGDLDDRGTTLSNSGDNMTFVDLGTNVEVESIYVGPLSDTNCVILSAPSSHAQRVKCWGRNTQNQLGYGDTNTRGDEPYEMGDNLTLIDFGIESRVKQLSLGTTYTCALLISDNMQCWGVGFHGQFAIGTADDFLLPGITSPFVPIDFGKTVKNIAVGFYHTCVLYADDATVKCVGLNDRGQLGRGSNNDIGRTPETTFPNISAIDLGLDDKKITKLYASYFGTCILVENSLLKCWGDNSAGHAGVGNRKAIGKRPYEMGANLTYIELFSPTHAPTSLPTTESPTSPTLQPTSSPTSVPTTKTPTNIPSFAPVSATPTTNPTTVITPTASTSLPIESPTTPTQPTLQPSNTPTKTPTSAPKNTPTKSPTKESGSASVTHHKSLSKIVVSSLLIVATMVIF